MAVLESQYSAQVNAMSDDILAPAQVTGVAHTVEQGKVILTWDAVTTNEDGSALADLGSYRIFRKKNSADAFSQIGQVDAAVLTYTDTAMKDGASYIYAVAAYDDEPTPNEGAKSADHAVKTIPSIPQGLAPTTFDNMIRLDWTSVQDGVDLELNENLAGYNVYRSEVDGGPYTVIGSAAASETSFEDSSAVNGTMYYYVITAYDNSPA